MRYGRSCTEEPVALFVGITRGLSLVVALSLGLVSANLAAQSTRAMHPEKARIIEHWTPERRAEATPRDLLIDPRGLGYLRQRDGSLSPYGHSIAAQDQAPRAGAGASADATGPTINSQDPGPGAVIGASYTFKATVTDPSGVKSVTFKIQKGSSTAQSFAAGKTTTANVWAVTLQGFVNGDDWRWWVVAKDGASRGGNTTTSPPVSFAVNTGNSGGGTDGTVASAHWTSGGAVTNASGRLYFEMPSNAQKTTWAGYVCSGTVATDGATSRSIILTAAHCVYDDANKAFARNVMFIPDQDGTTGTATDRNCSNDPIGCWVASVGVVDKNWTTRTFPNNVQWDYAFYVVPDLGAHQGNGSVSVLDDPAAAGSLPVSFGMPYHDDSLSKVDYTYALGYSYNEDPKLMYCSQDMTTNGAVNWWLPSCALTGGSSGGPWVQSMNLGTGFGNIVSVNSWGYTNSPGMAGPKLYGSSASCVFTAARNAVIPAVPYSNGSGSIAVCE